MGSHRRSPELHAFFTLLCILRPKGVSVSLGSTGKIPVMKIVLCLLLACVAPTQLPGQTTSTSQTQSPSPQAGATADNTSSALALRESLITVQAMAQKSDADLSRLRIDKWKTDSQIRKQSEANATSIRRNLTNAIPDLLLRVQAEPNSLIANFRLYRNLNALYDSFSSLTESAGAFGPQEQYSSLATDLTQLDQLRHQFAERVDQLAGASDAELARLRSKKSTNPATTKPPAKVVVDDNQPSAKKKPSKKAPPPQTQQ